MLQEHLTLLFSVNSSILVLLFGCWDPEKWVFCFALGILPLLDIFLIFLSFTASLDIFKCNFGFYVFHEAFQERGVFLL